MPVCQLRGNSKRMIKQGNILSDLDILVLRNLDLLPLIPESEFGSGSETETETGTGAIMTRPRRGSCRRSAMLRMKIDMRLLLYDVCHSSFAIKTLLRDTKTLTVATAAPVQELKTNLLRLV